MLQLTKRVDLLSSVVSGRRGGLRLGLNLIIEKPCDLIGLGRNAFS